MSEKYYVYRFKDKNENIIYVGRTANLINRFKNHEHLTKDVKRIEYIECDSEAEMAWKEIYYINLYYNELSMNVSDVYLNGKIKDIGLTDEWKTYSSKNFIDKNIQLTDEELIDNYQKYIINSPKYNYKDLINILDNHKLNSIGENIYSLSYQWFKKNQWLQENNKEYKVLKQLKNNIYNYFKNIIKSKSNENMWTTYIPFKSEINGQGYAKGFVDLREQIEFYNRNNLAYLKNNFYQQDQLNRISLDRDICALSEMLQFIFKSSLSTGSAINIYVPSIRMRKLLYNWIEEKSY